MIVPQAEGIVVVLMQSHHGDKLFLGRLARAIDVGIVLSESADTHQPVQLPGWLVAIYGPVLRVPDRQVAVAVRPGFVQHVVMRAVHRLEVVLLVVDHKRRVKILPVIGKVPRDVVDLAASNVRSDDPLVTALPLCLLRPFLKFLADDRPFRQPERQAPTNLAAKRE